MNNNTIILNELKEISLAVANINRKNVYSVPSGYFYGLDERLLIYVKEHSERTILGSSAIPYKVPQGYFDNLSNNILGKIKEQLSSETEVTKELAEIAPLLNTINKTSVYTIPEGYFDNLEYYKSTGSTPVVSISKTTQFMRYAAAAVITALVAIGGIFYANNNNNDNSLTAVPTFNQQEVNKLSDEEIIRYLNTNPAETDVTTINFEQEKQLQQHTKELTDEEIINFLKENGETAEIDNQEG